MASTKFLAFPEISCCDLFRVIEESNIPPNFTLSHEPAVGFAADATARYNGGLIVAVVSYGAGAFNLIDSTAGVNDMGGLCAMMIPDRLVTVFTPSRQSLLGALVELTDLAASGLDAFAAVVQFAKFRNDVAANLC